MTNADKIRGMTDAELADFIENVVDCWHCPVQPHCLSVYECNERLREWLRKAAE